MYNRYKKYAPYLIVAVIGALLGGGLVLGYGRDILQKRIPQASQESPLNNPLFNAPAAQAGVSDARNTPIVRAAKAAGPAVVGIANKGYARDFFNRKVLVEQGSGSGVIFDSNGYIVTNNHVVEGSQELAVSLSDGRVLTGKVIGTDPATDLAVVKVDATGLPTAAFGDSDSLLVGEPAIAIGNPLGLEFQGSVTSGVISALNRTVDTGERKFKLIQTDAAINPGNSGGALVNADGVIIGINSAKIAAQGVEGIGFAIPINTAKPIIQSLIEKGKVVRPYLGIGFIDQAMAEKNGYDFPYEQGVYVAKVDPEGPAGKAGILKGDVITKFAGVDIKSGSDLQGAKDGQSVGSKVDVVVQRGGQTLTLQIMLGETPSSQ
ncbi:MAG: trypsin-like peptidase domain-containing protein [Pelosinus sp.]|nr:trypsin-like peptidase domain-containing protein [Pelosinus sp.]